MRTWHRLLALLRTLFRGSRLDRDLDDEVRAYVEHHTARRVAGGMDPREARRITLAEEGGVESVKEHTRGARIGFGLATLARDLRFGGRALRRTPGFSVVACLTLALGVGASIAMFTVMRSVLWRPLPYPESERLVVIEADARGVRNVGIASGEVRDLRDRSQTLDRLAVANGVEAHVEAGGDVERVAAANVSDDLLPLLGAMPALGRLLDSRLDAGTPESPAARGVVISDALWRRRFGADPGVIGRMVGVNNRPREVVGVLAPGFKVFLPESVGTLEQTDVWFSTGIGETRNDRGAAAVGRLAPNNSLADAERELEVLAAQFAVEHPSIYREAALQFRLRGVRGAVTEHVGAGLNALGFAVAFVLLVSCVNVANLLIARGAGRTRELAVRRALGATRGRLIRQLLTESLLLSVMGSALGVVLGRWAIDALDWLRPTHLPRQSEIAMDLSVAGFAVGVAVLAGLVFGTLPALKLAGSGARSPAPGRGDTPGRGTRRLQRGLVIGEIALSIVPLVVAGLMLRSFVNLAQTPLGFEADRVLTVWMPISFRQFPDFDARWRVHAAAMEGVGALPGVEAVSAVSPVPFGPLQFTRRYGRAGDGVPAAIATMQVTFPGYLDVAGTRVVQGRDFTPEDMKERRPVVVIDVRMARALWPDGAVGQRLALGSSQKVLELEVVGVTEPVRTRQVRDDSLPNLLLPYHLFPVEMALAIRTDPRAGDLEPAIKRVVAALGTGRAVEARPLSEFVRDSMAETRFIMLVLSAFALASLLLAAIGLYGTLAYLTSQRSREFGLRLALGSTRGQVLSLVAGEGLLLTAIGALVGVAGALGAAHILRRLLYGVDPIDLPTLGLVAVLVSAIAVVACLRPAWNAGNVDPAITLKSE